tara:strand:- start:68448 stop:69068 length:621 start_codon:yes stop_codon:yes gene_type:complete
MAIRYPHLSETLRKLLFNRNMKATDLAREIHVPQPTVHRLVTGKSKRPYATSLEPIAEYFDITVDQLVGDEPLDDEIIPVAPGATTVAMTPWHELANSDYQTNDHVIVSHIGTQNFATAMRDTSMEPIFPRNTTLIFDKEKPATDRTYVLVKLHNDKSIIFRQLIIDGKNQYLKPLNPDLTEFSMLQLADADDIMGTLVEARQLFE